MMSFAFALASPIVISGNVPSVFHTCLPFGLRVIARNCFDPVGAQALTGHADGRCLFRFERGHTLVGEIASHAFFLRLTISKRFEGSNAD